MKCLPTETVSCMGSNHTDTCVCLFCWLCPVCRQRSCDGLIPVEGIAPIMHRIEKLKERPRPNNEPDRHQYEHCHKLIVVWHTDLDSDWKLDLFAFLTTTTNYNNLTALNLHLYLNLNSSWTNWDLLLGSIAALRLFDLSRTKT
jgi:hypothetical protein